MLHFVVQLSWQTGSGETKVARAQCLNLSQQGAGIECNQPIEARTMVYLQAPAYGLMGNASVRYCRRAGLKYRMGLLFSVSPTLADPARKKSLRDRDQLSA